MGVVLFSRLLNWWLDTKGASSVARGHWGFGAIRKTQNPI